MPPVAVSCKWLCSLPTTIQLLVLRSLSRTTVHSTIESIAVELDYVSRLPRLLPCADPLHEGPKGAEPDELDRLPLELVALDDRLK